MHVKLMEYFHMPFHMVMISNRKFHMYVKCLRLFTCIFHILFHMFVLFTCISHVFHIVLPSSARGPVKTPIPKYPEQ